MNLTWMAGDRKYPVSISGNFQKILIVIRLEIGKFCIAIAFKFILLTTLSFRLDFIKHANLISVAD